MKPISKLCLKKSKIWSIQQDEGIQQLVSNYGKKWSIISWQLKKMHNSKKTAKQCRQRWYNHLNPEISFKQWTEEEEDTLLKQHQKYGSKWKKIAENFEGRTQNSIKNHFYSIVRKILRKINKFLGTKNGSAKVRKIKSSTISKIFSQNATSEVEEQSRIQTVAYEVINFSRKKLDKQTIKQKDLEKFSLLLEEIYKFNNIYQNQKIGKMNGQKNQNMAVDQLSNGQSDSQNDHESLQQQIQKQQIKKQENQDDRLNNFQNNTLKPEKIIESGTEIKKQIFSSNHLLNNQFFKRHQGQPFFQNFIKDHLQKNPNFRRQLKNILNLYEQQHQQQRVNKIYQKVKQRIKIQLMQEIRQNLTTMMLGTSGHIFIIPSSSIIVNGGQFTPYSFLSSQNMRCNCHSTDDNGKKF